MGVLLGFAQCDTLVLLHMGSLGPRGVLLGFGQCDTQSLLHMGSLLAIGVVCEFFWDLHNVTL